MKFQNLRINVLFRVAYVSSVWYAWLCLMSFVSSELLVQCSSKVVAAYLESSDSKVKDLAKSELQLLVDGGKLKIPDHKAAEKK
jgi:hypothetical protein